MKSFERNGWHAKTPPLSYSYDAWQYADAYIRAASHADERLFVHLNAFRYGMVVWLQNALADGRLHSSVEIFHIIEDAVLGQRTKRGKNNAWKGGLSQYFKSNYAGVTGHHKVGETDKTLNAVLHVKESELAVDRG